MGPTLLNIDTLIEVCVWLGLEGTMRLLTTCTTLRAFDGDAFFRALAFRFFSHAFWHRASGRHQAACRTWKAELMRIERFQRCVHRLEGQRWGEADFFVLWNAEDQGMVVAKRRKSGRRPCEIVS